MAILLNLVKSRNGEKMCTKSNVQIFKYVIKVCVDPIGGIPTHTCYCAYIYIYIYIYFTPRCRVYVMRMYDFCTDM